MNYTTPSQPRQIRLDTTTRCNAKCLSCHRYISKRDGEMPWEFVEEIISALAKWKQPLEELIPVNYGEALLYPKWHELLKLCAQKLPRTQIVLPTNGWLLDEENVKKLCSIPTLRLINFSINAYFHDTYTAFMGLPQENLIRIHTAIQQFRSLRPNLPLWFSMVFDPVYQTDNERDVFEAYYQQFGKVWIIPAATCNRTDKPIQIPNNQPCRSLFSDFVIGFDGKLTSCCFDAGMVLNLGHYSGDILKDWRNPLLEELRKLHNEGKRQENTWCKGCSFA